jgi:hypothetical protein
MLGVVEREEEKKKKESRNQKRNKSVGGLGRPSRLCAAPVRANSRRRTREKSNNNNKI